MKPGDVAHDFELPDETGTPRRLSVLLEDGPVVLFFYPMALSSGCTAEACHFRDLSAELDAVGARAVGISRDSVDRQREFATKHNLGYPLLSDTDATVAGAFGVRRRLLAKVLPVKRSTFVIGTDGTVLDVISSETNMGVHADKALAALTAAMG
ncbi:MAG: peroxiredoxin [Mycobacteriales bacterium]